MVKSGTLPTQIYTITDMVGGQAIVTLTVNTITGNVVALSGSGNLHADGMAMLSTLILELQTQLVP
jgi:hypothetical protein